VLIRFKDARIAKYIKEHGGRGGDAPLSTIAEALLLRHLFGDNDEDATILKFRRMVDGKRDEVRELQEAYERAESELAIIEGQAAQVLGRPLCRA
jgi:hypothetical protein